MYPRVETGGELTGKLGLRSFSIVLFSYTAPIRILTQAMPLIPRDLLAEGTNRSILRVRAIGGREDPALRRNRRAPSYV